MRKVICSLAAILFALFFLAPNAARHTAYAAGVTGPIVSVMMNHDVSRPLTTLLARCGALALVG